MHITEHFLETAENLNCLGMERKKHSESLSNIFKSSLNCGARSSLDPHEPRFMQSVAVWPLRCRPAQLTDCKYLWANADPKWHFQPAWCSAAWRCWVRSGVSLPWVLHQTQLGANVAKLLSSPASCRRTVCSPGSALCSIPCCLLVAAWLW